MTSIALEDFDSNFGSLIGKEFPSRLEELILTRHYQFLFPEIRCYSK